MTAYIIITISSLCAAMGQILLKMGASNRASVWDFVNGYTFSGCLLYFVGLCLWIWSLSKLPLSIAYLFTLLTFVAVFVLSKLLLHENISVLTLGGIVLIGLGFWLIFLGQRHLLS